MKKFFYSITICICAIVMAACSSNNTPTGAAEAYLDNVKSGDYAEVVDQLYFNNEVTAEQKAELVTALEEKAKESAAKGKAIKDYKITGEEIKEEGDKAVVTYIAIKEDGSEDSEKINLVKKDEKWLIDAGK